MNKILIIGGSSISAELLLKLHKEFGNDSVIMSATEAKEKGIMDIPMFNEEIKEIKAFELTRIESLQDCRIDIYPKRDKRQEKLRQRNYKK